MINKFQAGGQAAKQQQQQILMQAAQVLQQSGYNVTDGQGNLDQNAFIQAVAKYGQEKLGVQVNQQNIGQVIMTIAQQGTQMAKKGIKLNYLKKITNKCPEGTQLTYYKVGGQICSKCEAMAKQQKTANVIDTIKAEMFQGGGKTATKKTPAKKQLDQAGRDSIAVNKYNDQEIQTSRPGNYKPNKNGGTTWVPDRTKAPYKKEKKEEGGNITTKACPKCGKVHTGKCGAKLKEMKCGSKMKKAKKHEIGGILEAMKNIQLK